MKLGLPDLLLPLMNQSPNAHELDYLTQGSINIRGRTHGCVYSIDWHLCDYTRPESIYEAYVKYAAA